MIRCIAVDDESPALDLLEDNIRQVSFLQLVKRCKNAYEASAILNSEQVDLIFLDIQMPGISGINFIRNLPVKPMVIFITAYRKYAVDGFDVDALDYLIKPVSFERFLKSANKALAVYNQQKESANQSQEPACLFINTEYNRVKLDIAGINYIEGCKNYIKIYQDSSLRPLLTRLSMKAMEEKLPGSKFIRVHKSFIIAIDSISSIRREFIVIGNKKIPLSKLYREAFFKQINIRK